MSTEIDQCPIELSWATFQRKVPSGRNDGIVHDIPLMSLRLDLLVPQPAPDPLVVYICDVAILAVFKRAKGVTGDQKVHVVVRTTNFPISEPSPFEIDVALPAKAESVSPWGGRTGLEPFNKNPFVRFHALQSIFLTVALFVLNFASMLLGSALGLAGLAVLPLLWLATLGLWIVLIYKAYQIRIFKLPVIGDLAEQRAHNV
jgi:uncharacterized membrane protein